MGFQPNVGILPFFSSVSCLDFKPLDSKIFCYVPNSSLGWTLDAHSAMIGQFGCIPQFLYAFNFNFEKKMVILLSSKMLGWH